MAYITGSVADSLGTLPFSLSAGTQLTMSIQNNDNAPSYFGLETIPNNNGLYVSGSTPKNLSGSFITNSGISNIVYDDYKIVAVVNPGGGTLTYTPAINISASTLWTKGTAASLQPGDFPYALTNGFSSRVTRDGGIIEDPDAIINTINSQPLLQNASYLMVPSGYKAGTLYSELSTNNYSDLTWTRASSGSRLNSLGNIENMGLNIPRLDYTYGTDPAALLEPQRTNLILQSEAFDNASWTAIDSTVTANSEISPDGTQNAETMTISLSTSRVSQNVVFGAGTYKVSVYVKLVSQTSPGTMRIVGVVDGANVNINFTPTSQWQRIDGTYTATVGITNLAIRGVASSFIGTVAIWGFQAEAGAYPTTYIPTTTASATRVADSFSRNNIYTNGLITSSGGTWFFELDNNLSLVRDASTNFFIGTTNNGNTNTSLGVRNNGSTSQRLSVYKRISGTPTGLYSTLTDTIKVGIKWNGTTADVFVNGVKVHSATAFTETVMEFLQGDGLDVPKYIKQMALYPIPLSDAECITLTTL
jgi:hypothetical protein